ncbi:MAG: EAL domain-containing protein, partial [Pseudomonadota bacterium]
LSHKLGKTVVAEGVDSQDELDFLMLRGCDIYQGFYTSMAVPSGEFARRFLLTDETGPTS